MIHFDTTSDQRAFIANLESQVQAAISDRSYGIEGNCVIFLDEASTKVMSFDLETKVMGCKSEVDKVIIDKAYEFLYSNFNILEDFLAHAVKEFSEYIPYISVG